MTPCVKYWRPLSVSVNARPPLTSRALKSWLNQVPDARKLSLSRMWKESRMGPVGLKPQGGSSNHVGVWLKYLWVSLSHLLGPAREAPRF